MYKSGVERYNESVNDIQELLVQLKTGGWTKAALSDELGVSYDSVERWERGTIPRNSKGVVLQLQELLKRRRTVPKRRRYTEGSRRQSNPPTT